MEEESEPTGQDPDGKIDNAGLDEMEPCEDSDPDYEIEACPVCARMPQNEWNGECSNCEFWTQPCPKCGKLYEPDEGCIECGYGTEE